VEDTIGDQGVDVPVQGDQVAEGLHQKDEAGLAIGSGRAVGFGEQTTDDAPQLAQAVALMRRDTGKCR